MLWDWGLSLLSHHSPYLVWLSLFGHHITSLVYFGGGGAVCCD